MSASLAFSSSVPDSQCVQDLVPDRHELDRFDECRADHPWLTIDSELSRWGDPRQLIELGIDDRRRRTVTA